MTVAGWFLMLGSVSFVVSLTGWCFYRVVTAPHRHGATNRSEPGNAA
jgi:hypothetical protein